MADYKETERLIAQIQAGDTDAFAKLYDLYFRPIYFFALKLTGNPEDAADVTQDTFVNAYENIGGISEPAAFAKWLSRIAHNKSIDMLRRRNKLDTQAEVEQFSETLLEENEEFLPEHCLETRERRQRVSLLVDKLPEAQRAAILLFYYQDFSTEQIADITGSKIATVRKRLFDARQKLRNWFEEETEEKNYGVMAVFVLTRIFLEEAEFLATPALQEALWAGVSGKLGLALQSPPGSEASVAGQSAASGSLPGAAAGGAVASHTIMGVVAVAAVAVATITGVVLVVRHNNTSNPIPAEVSDSASAGVQASQITGESGPTPESPSEPGLAPVPESATVEPYPTSAPESSQAESISQPDSIASDDSVDYYRPGKLSMGKGTSEGENPNPPQQPSQGDPSSAAPAGGPIIFLTKTQLVYQVNKLSSIEQLIYDCGLEVYDPQGDMIPFTLYEKDGKNTIYTNIPGEYHIIISATHNGIEATKELTLYIIA